MDSESNLESHKQGQPVSSGELNSWRRGFTPQAEIWNGRMAMFGIVVGLGALILVHIFL